MDLDVPPPPPPPPGDVPPPPPPPPSNDLPPPPPDDILPPPPPPPTDDLPPPPPPPPADILPPPGAPSPAANGVNGTNGVKAPRKEPLSIEEILRQKREAAAAAAKPKFIPKAKRERMAREQAERERQLQAQKTLEAKRNRFENNGVNGTTNGDSRYSIPTGPRAMRNGEIPTGPAAMRSGAGKTNDNTSSNGKSVTVKEPKGEKRPPTNPEEAEYELIKQRYMGSDNNTSNFSAKKKRRRTTEKKFNFEWNVEEDTSTDYNPLYQTRTEATFFGRGRLGGMADDDKVARKYVQAIQQHDKEAGLTRAQEIMEMDRRKREEGAKAGIDKHWSEKPLELMRERDWRIFKEDFNISTKGGSIPNPMRSWAESGLPPALLKIIDDVGYREPSAVQRAAIPIALQNRDLIGVAVTGSGKTAAFLLPLLVYINDLPPLDEYTRNDGPYAIILAPTRELAQQIELEANKFATPMGFKCVSLVGGHSIEEQAYNMRDGAHIIIATPGRLLDCIERRVLVLNQCCYVIMDEADRMIDLGFEEPVRKILDALPVTNQKPDDESAENAAAMSRFLGGKERYRQTMMYTATMPTAVERIARNYLRRPAIVTIGNVGEAVDTVEQRVEFVAGEEKRKKRLQEILNSQEFAPPIIVFVNIKRNCDTVARDVQKMGHSAVSLHGSKTQDQREKALADLREGRAEVLVATDLAGRGIDVPDVSLVVNFNMATNIESYTHRIGRTGRAGKSGVAITFVSNDDADVLYDLKQMIQKSSISRVPEELRKHPDAQQKRGSKKGGAAVVN